MLIGVLVAAAAVTGANVGPPSRAAKAAVLLVAADGHAQSRNRAADKRLVEAVASFERIGLHAAGPEDAALLEGWQARVASFAAPTWRGRVLGPAFRRGMLAPGETVRTEQLFMAGQQATVAVAAAKGSAVRLAVRGPGANAVCERGSVDCSWQPIFTERYAIEVHNPTARPARYYLVTD